MEILMFFLVIGLIGLGGIALFLAGAMTVASLIKKAIQWLIK